MSRGIEFPTGIARGPNREVWLASMTSHDADAQPYRFARSDQFGGPQDVFAGGGEGIAVSVDGEIYVTVSTSPYLRKYSPPGEAP